MTFHIYKDKADKFRWRLKAVNGIIIADSGQGYAFKQGCMDGVRNMKTQVAQANVIDDTVG